MWECVQSCAPRCQGKKLRSLFTDRNSNADAEIGVKRAQRGKYSGIDVPI